MFEYKIFSVWVENFQCFRTTFSVFEYKIQIDGLTVAGTGHPEDALYTLAEDWTTSHWVIPLPPQKNTGCRSMGPSGVTQKTVSCSERISLLNYMIRYYQPSIYYKWVVLQNAPYLKNVKQYRDRSQNIPKQAQGFLCSTLDLTQLQRISNEPSSNPFWQYQCRVEFTKLERFDHVSFTAPSINTSRQWLITNAGRGTKQTCFPP